MYYFIFDYPTTKRLADLAKNIEDAVVDSGIAGEIIELNPTKNLDNLLADASQKGYQTLVIVGGAKLVNKTAAKLLRYDMVLGVIPLGEIPTLFEKIKCENWQEAVAALKRRRWEHTPLGHINNTNIFLTRAKLDLESITKIKIAVKGFELETEVESAIVTTTANKRGENLVTVTSFGPKEKKGFLKNIFGSKTAEDNKYSKFSYPSITIDSEEPISIDVDHLTIGRTPATFSVIPKALRLIVGKKG